MEELTLRAATTAPQTVENPEKKLNEVHVLLVQPP